MGAILQFDRYHEQSKKSKNSRIYTRSGTTKLYIDLWPNGIRVQRSSGLDDTPENREILQKWVDRQQLRIENGTFRFSEAFPNASEKDKAKHAKLEGRYIKPNGNRILFVDYIDTWEKKNIPLMTPGKQKDYKGVIDYWLKPFFKDKFFNEITGITLKDFVKQLNRKEGLKKWQPLSASRVNNILIVLRHIWYDAFEEYQWERTDPFAFIKRFLKQDLEDRPQKPDPVVFRFDEWEQILNHMDPYFRPVAEVMLRTGMIGSEIAGLKKSAVHQDHLFVEYSIVRKHQKEKLKTKYRKRKIPLTKKLKEIFNQAAYKSDSEFLFVMKSGVEFDIDTFRKNAWTTALKKAGIQYKVPYTMRHTFAAWSLVLDVHPTRLVKLMGHGSKKMVYEVYGNYVEDLETDAGKIRRYFGNDFK